MAQKPKTLQVLNKIDAAVPECDISHLSEHKFYVLF